MPMRLLLAALLLVHGAAIGQTFACQYTQSAGLDWENGTWKSRYLEIPRPFFLVVEGGNLTADSAAKVLGSLPKEARCERHPIGFYSCHTPLTSFLFFNPKELHGVRSEMRGAILRPEARGTHPLSVAPFICQQM